MVWKNFWKSKLWVFIAPLNEHILAVFRIQTPPQTTLILWKFHSNIVWRRFEPTSTDNPLYMPNPSVFYFCPSDSFLTTIFWQYHDDKIWGKSKNKLMRESSFFIFRRQLKPLHFFFCKKHLYKQHQVEIWFKIIVITVVKSSQKKTKQYKWRICRVKRIIATSSYIANEKQC